mmetsp:Transcript_43471/g.112596  ORF Transcript_43471/g.112596 Transcript_43471/m.112596 type:complete len:285 (+) Transcript_43471:328-1182(+)
MTEVHPAGQHVVPPHPLHAVLHVTLLPFVRRAALGLVLLVREARADERELPAGRAVQLLGLHRHKAELVLALHKVLDGLLIAEVHLEQRHHRLRLGVRLAAQAGDLPRVGAGNPAPEEDGSGVRKHAPPALDPARAEVAQSWESQPGGALGQQGAKARHQHPSLSIRQPSEGVVHLLARHQRSATLGNHRPDDVTWCGACCAASWARPRSARGSARGGRRAAIGRPVAAQCRRLGLAATDSVAATAKRSRVAPRILSRPRGVLSWTFLSSDLSAGRGGGARRKQ